MLGQKREVLCLSIALALHAFRLFSGSFNGQVPLADCLLIVKQFEVKVHQVNMAMRCALLVKHPFLLLVLDPPQELCISGRKVELLDDMSKVVQCCSLNFILERLFGEELKL
eukprot:520570-Ditylum_brightwellii.AAC.1